QALCQSLSKYGFIKVSDIVSADIVILNTCSVRAQAEQKAFSWLGRAQELKKQKRDLKIAVIGCMAQRLGEKISKRFKSVDLVIGAKNLHNAAQQILSLKKEQSEVPVLNNTPPASVRPAVEPVVIMRGCDNYCSYCVVPYVRGHEVSVDCETIVTQCEKASQNGAQEIMLLGQNVNSYNYKGVNFASLLRKIAKIQSVKNLTFMTSHPKDLSGELISAMAEEPKIKKYIHLPMQSACDKILELMNRKYTYAHYKSLIDKIREKIPQINITTDIIVGFPQETGEDFNQTLQAVKDIGFNALFAFKYSPRPNTKAADMQDDVPLAEKKRRHNLILEEARRGK
ncbi:MAG: tRNA (N6-isopentenyl adenosine(37)-C2)-methylthiotransferase MiaB, partial [Endomicrobium sp.]|nr:tRNA (N6-isopentenyl adenosine(37)-C2)-methylthiotransferase MiaB [Endomicrobium sp.]